MLNSPVSGSFAGGSNNFTRRDFIRNVAVGMPLLSLTARVLGAPLSSAGEVPAPRKMSAVDSKINESNRQIPVARDVDVVIVGGGPTGIGAALAAASEKAKTVLIERHGMLGGMWTAGLLNPVFDSQKGWLVDSLISRLKKVNAWRPGSMPVFDTEAMKYTLERMLYEANVEFWYHCAATKPIVDNQVVRGVIVEGKSGREAVLAKVVIDCTGDGDIAARAGVPSQCGREKDGLSQPMTLMFEIEGIQGLDGVPFAQLEAEKIMSPLIKAVKQHNLQISFPYGPQRSGTPYLVALPRKGAAVIQATHVYKYDATDTRSLTRAITEARDQVHAIFMPALRKIPGMENICLTQTAASIGIRESRHMEGQYRLELDDMINARQFDDAVTAIGFHIDVHEIDPQDTSPKLPEFPAGITRHNIPKCEIPYRCLLPRKIRGLLFAGRCISGSHHVCGAYRVTGTCMAMGQAAGLAAAMAAKSNLSPGDIKGRILRTALEERGVIFRNKR